MKNADPKVNFVELEKKWLTWWKENNIEEKYLKKNQSSGKKFYFLDGPITANNPMAVHHAWGRTYKDLWQRFKNMQGYKQTFKNGFDNQGLWVEVIVEKELGFKTKKDIEKYGIEKFVNKCKAATLYWADVQTKQTQRLGNFMDWDNSYYTMSDENNYTIWYFLKQCHQKGLLYKGKDSVPWCPRCGTAISQHEILQEEYQEITHDSVYFGLPVSGREDERFLVWTTTPWTLPANVALAVNPVLEYYLVSDQNGNKYWISGDLTKEIFGSGVKVVKKVLGKELVGLKYEGPFDKLPAVIEAKKSNPQTFHSVVASEEMVTAREGTGIVHIATGGGSEDFALGRAENLPVLAAIDEAANYIEGFADLTGKNAKDNPRLILDHPLLNRKIGGNSFLFKIKPFAHRYPVCWRCKTELVWRVVDEWYIKMDPLREPLKKSSGQATWIPSWGLDREIDWLNNMSDWLISKKRYWGLALPIWECECGHFEVIGSKEELKERAVEGFDTFDGNSPHRPWVDEVRIKCSECGKIAKRIKDVGNPWLDAGIVPFSTLIDPKTKKVSYLTDKKYWAEWFPADFVVECFPGQFKNWFYSILAMSTVLEGCSPFKTLLGHALVRDEKGEEMHKSKGNAIWFDEAAEKMGVDVMRWMYVTQNPVNNLSFGYRVADETRRRFILLLWNVYNYFTTFAINEKWKKGGDPHKSTNILDIWIMTLLNSLVKTVTECLENYDAYNASIAIEKFVENLSTWYIRRSRKRISPVEKDKKDMDFYFTTLHEVLTCLCRILAPFTPFISEEMYKNLTDEESVHLTDWPKVGVINKQLETDMEFVRDVCVIGHSQRKQNEVKVRQPLSKFEITNSKHEIDKELIELIKEELNVKEVVVKTGSGEMKGEFDLKITPTLRAEGEARDIIRQIQEARKEAGCNINDLVEVGLPSWPKEFEEIIKKETLASRIYTALGLEIKS